MPFAAAHDATLMLEGGAELRFIQEMLGHTDPKTTQIYAQVSIRKLRQIHAATHPGALLAARAASDGGAPRSNDAADELILALAAETDGEDEERDDDV